MFEKIKAFIKDIPSNAWTYIILMVILALAVVYFCGIKGNNQENFWKKADFQVEIPEEVDALQS